MTGHMTESSTLNCSISLLIIFSACPTVVKMLYPHFPVANLILQRGKRDCKRECVMSEIQAARWHMALGQVKDKSAALPGQQLGETELHEM